MSDPDPLQAVLSASPDELRGLAKALVATLVGMDCVHPTGGHLGEIIKIAIALQETGEDDQEGLDRAVMGVVGRLLELRGN